MSEHADTQPFRAEVAALLRLVTHSLYTNREIFLRELVSNAADALDKARFAALVEPDLAGKDEPARITITIDQERNVLAIEDTGIGMTQGELAVDLGTIAHSGTLRFFEEMRKRGEGKADIELIGQFGVGFYSAFMVANRIEVESLSARPGAEPARWSSEGADFTLGPGTRKTRGTRVELQLKDDAVELLDRHRIEHLVKHYSNYVLHPIVLRLVEPDGTALGEAKQLNAAKAFWAQNPKELSEADYEEFFTHVMGGFMLPSDKPLAHLHTSMDAPIQFRAVLFVPGRRPLDLFADDARHLQLYARRVLVMESCDKLLPAYLRFFRGVVDSEDLPLNVSREMLQEHTSLAAIRRQLTRKALGLLESTAKDDPERYAKIWKEFGVFVKEGLHTDNAHRDQLIELLRFASTSKPGELSSLREVVEAMPADQEAIYYVTGEDAADLGQSPHLEACRARGWTVVLMTDPVDEWVVQDLHEYQGKPLRSVTQGDLDLGAKEGEAAAEGALAALVERAKAVLGDRVKDVRPSRRLVESASCLVDDEGGLGRNMERLLRMSGRELQPLPRVLELNPGHAFVRALDERVRARPDDADTPLLVELLLDQAHLADGDVPEPAATVKRIQALMDKLA